jgi:hypothetical protein
MKRRTDWDRLRRPALLLMASLLLAAMTAGLSAWFRSDSAETLRRVSVVRDAAFQRLRTLEQQQRDIAAFQAPFLVLQERGLIGPESRLAWIETIQSAQQVRRLLAASYEIEAQQAVAAPVELAGYRLRGSRMQLHLGLLHELDLFMFLDDLRHAGIYSMEDCRMRRVALPPSTTEAPRLLADCTLVWLTLEGGQP